MTKMKIVTAFALGLGISNPAIAQGSQMENMPNDERKTMTAKVQNDAAEQIWAKEQAIFDGRMKGDLSAYVNAIGDDYLGWPPVLPEPLSMEKFKEDAPSGIALRGEVITMKRRGLSFSGDTALAYFSTHRTMLGEGFAEGEARKVDQRYENIHVWQLQAGDWRLIGGMARITPDRKQD